MAEAGSASLPLPWPPESVESSQCNYLLGEGGFTLEILCRVWREDWQECEPTLRAAAAEGQFRKRDGSGEGGKEAGEEPRLWICENTFKVFTESS